MRSAKAIGIVYDLSGQIGPDKRRFLDTMPAAMAQFLWRLLEDFEDVVYVHSANNVSAQYVKGAQVAAASHHGSDGSRLNLSYALVQTMYVLCAEDVNLDRIVIYITDRFEKNNVVDLRRVLDRNKREELGCSLIAVGIGNCYDDAALMEVCPDFHHLDTADNLVPLLAKEIPFDV